MSILARSLHIFSIKKTRLPKSLYLREVAKIASQCVHRAEMDASNRRIIHSHCRLTVQPSQHIGSIRPTQWQCFMPLTFPITPTEQGAHMCKKAWKQRQNGQHTHVFSSGDNAQKMNRHIWLFVWICVHAHTQQRLLVASSSICHGLPQCPPHLNSIILFMSFCFLACCKRFWILQQEWNKSQVVLLLPHSYGIILSWWPDIHLKNSSFPCLLFWNE